ncbi:WhiB family transcriptional regulator [Actinophytocola gossypii]|uniref:Transcriptional regulator WhiB n=1 Tax=Actinophytocola gossypii TaxID=2812003 RepID=A0ABT2JIR2_9PSEU|nr:WhiB family transcriptional regulator [Actinophytocola gossypii]MCT2587775.1 WhiB family transcriptional regulator [Actinophytocola gossypii]
MKLAQRAVNRTDSLWELLDLGDPASTEWMRDGLCAQTDPEEFFPGKGGDLRPAKAVCAGCPVLDRCRDYAVGRPELSGIWGGTTARERVALRVAAAADDTDRQAA